MSEWMGDRKRRDDGSNEGKFLPVKGKRSLLLSEDKKETWRRNNKGR